MAFIYLIPKASVHLHKQLPLPLKICKLKIGQHVSHPVTFVYRNTDINNIEVSNICYGFQDIHAIPQLKEKLNKISFFPLLLVPVNWMPFDLRLQQCRRALDNVSSYTKVSWSVSASYENTRLIKWLTSTLHSSEALNGCPRQTQLKVNIRTNDKRGLLQMPSKISDDSHRLSHLHVKSFI